MEGTSKWKRIMSSSQFSLSHPDPARFVRSAWQADTDSLVFPFVLYRVVVTGVFLAVLVWSWYTFWNHGLWFVFLTNWGYLACALQALMGTILVLAAYWKQKTSNIIDSMFDLTHYESPMPLSYKIYWLLYNIAVTNAIFITILYWSILYNPNQESDGPFMLNFATHGANSVMCVLELVVCGLPSRFLHCMQPIFFTVVYIIFNLIYWAAGGLGVNDTTYIYPVLDWEKNPGLGVGIIFGGAALLLIVHTIVCCLAELRNMLTQNIRKRKENNIVISTLPSLSAGGNSNKGFSP